MALSPGEYLVSKYQIQISDANILSKVECLEIGWHVDCFNDKDGKSTNEHTYPIPAMDKDVKIVAIVLKEYASMETKNILKINLRAEDEKGKLIEVHNNYRVNNKLRTDILMPLCAHDVDRIWYKMEDIQMSVIKTYFPQYSYKDYTLGITKQTEDDVEVWYLPIEMKKNKPNEPICPLGFICNELSNVPENPFHRFELTRDKVHTTKGDLEAIKISKDDGERILGLIEQLMQDQRLSTNLNRLRLSIGSQGSFSLYLKLEIYYCED